jgi:carboxylesterase
MVDYAHGEWCNLMENPLNDIPHIRRGAEPFLLDGGEVGCVCIHGFTASPEEMRWLGETLHARGLTVYGPRLSGHGTSPAMLRRQHWMNWYEDVISGVALLRTRCRTVYAVGLSMGGLLSLRVAAAGLVDGAVVMAAPLVLNQRLMRFSSAISRVKPYRVPTPGDLDARVVEAQRATGRDDYGRVAYDDLMPLASVGQLYALMQDVRAHLHDVTVPLLLVYSTADRTVPYDNMRQVAEGVRCTDLVLHTLERSGHVLTQDIERETVYELVWNFIAARLP